MRKLAVLSIVIALICSCTNDQVVDHSGKDSIPDTANTVANNNDTFHVDSGNVSNTYYDCSVLNRKIPADSNQKQLRNDLAQLVHCGIDSFDFLYVVPNLFPGFVSENHVQGKTITYGDFVKHVNEFKASPAYAQLHTKVQTLDSLRSTPFDVTKVYAMKPTLGKLGFTEPEWEMFSGFAQTYPVPKKGVFTWGNMLEAFDKYKPKE
ncbi:MAG TPA: hypothetical protein VFJ43_18430 [Bacteroidia bacterium]|nr:hypothetical protein [Bacteroidia bacterium]